MLQNSTITIQEGVNCKLLDDVRKDRGLTIKALAEGCKIAEGTVKNICNGSVTNPQICSIYAICKFLCIPIEQVLLGRDDKQTVMEVKAIKQEQVSVIALKEIYEQQMKETKEINEAHISNIRTHYEQHRKDLTDNYEKRLADKMEIIDLLTKENLKLKAQLEKKEHDTYIGNLIRNCIIGLFVCGTIALLVLEFIYIEKGWITFR